MNMIENLCLENQDRLEEIAAFHWFMEACGHAYENLEIGESPDFVAALEGRRIGIEITEAHRQIVGSPYPIIQVEQAQRAFAEELLDAVEPAIPLDIGLILNDDVPVEKSASESIPPIATAIRDVSAQMAQHSVELLVRGPNDLERSSQRKHVCPEIPEFIQHIQLFNDGHKHTLITGSRGGIVPALSREEFDTALVKKHNALKKYRKCDEHWLVVVTGTVPAIFMPKGPPRLLIPSVSTTFSGLGFEPPVESYFDKVFFFKSPTEVIRLTA